MKPPKIVFVCQECGSQASKWMGRCADCGAWNSLVEERAVEAAPPAASPGAASSRYALGRSDGARLSADIELTDATRLRTGLDEFDRVLGGGIVPGSLVLLGGEPGIGKSRLLMEFTSQVETNESTLRVLSTRALGQAGQVPFYIWKSLWNSSLGLRDDDPPRNAREKLIVEIRKLWGKELGPASALETAHLIGHLLGIDWPDSSFLAALKTPQERIQRAFELTRELFRRICGSRMTLLLIDDLQWADRNSLELLDYVLRPGKERMPLLVLGGARPQFFQAHPEWADRGQTLTLGPLPIKSADVAEAYPDLADMPTPMLEALARQAEGNPYFLEEMVKNLLKSGGDAGGAERAIERLRTQPPESLQAALQARLDTLPREIRAFALLAAVVGRVFWVGAVLAAMRVASRLGTASFPQGALADTDPLIREALKRLEQAELVFPRAGYTFSRDQEYIFKSSLLRDVAYSLIPLRVRPNYHRAVADWLGARPDVDFKVMAAEHYEQADRPMEAALYYEQAARNASARGATTEAERMVQRAAALRVKAQSPPTDLPGL